MPDRRKSSREERLFDDSLAILLEEWRHCQAGIGRYDGLQFQIRGWATSLVVATVAATVSLHQPRLAFIGVMVALLFWISEAMYDYAQGVFIRRAEELEGLLASRIRGQDMPPEISAPLISTRFKEAFGNSNWRRAWEVAKRGTVVSVLFTYASLAAVCVSCYFLVPTV